MEIVVIDRNVSTENQDNVADLGAQHAVPAGNGNLTRELFEAAGLTIAEQAPAQSTSPVGRIQPGKMDIVRRGEEAMACLVGKRTWTDWVAVMAALDIGRTTAMQEAGTNKSNGTRYHTAIAKWLRLHPVFDKMDPGDRSRLLKCFDNLAAIESWREARTQKKPKQLLKLNNPLYVLRRWEAEEGEKKEKKRSGSNGDRAASSSFPLPKLADIWPISTEEEKCAELKRETRLTLTKLLSQTEFADHALAQQEIADHALVQEIDSTPMPRKNVVGDVRVALTRIVREIASAPTPERRANAVELLIQKCAANNLHPSKLVAGHWDYTPPLTAQRAVKRKGARDL